MTSVSKLFHYPLRKFLLMFLALLLLSCFGSHCFISTLGGSFSYEPSQLKAKLSPNAKQLLKKAFQGVEPARLLDYHAHLAGLGTGGSGAFVNSRMQSWYHPFHWLKYKVYMSAAGVRNEERADQEYVERLLDLIRSMPHGKQLIFAFDKHYNLAGEADLAKTEFYIPNEYAYSIAQKYPDIFLTVVSIHPYRKDALEELNSWAQKGIRYIKWLPNAMGIDPSHPKTEPYYHLMKKHNMVLISHSGEEKAVEAKEDQRLGNPLLLRKPLDMGVKVIIAHCASLGKDIDLDDPQKKKRDSFDLFLRLMQEKKYSRLLFADISAMTQFNRLPRPLITMLDRKDLHPRLVNGSDYPLPAINVLIRTGRLLKHGLISAKERDALNEIYSINPLLFDFVVKRSLRSPKTKRSFPISLFYRNPLI